VIVITPRHQVAVLLAGEFHDRTDAGLTVGEINALAFYGGAHEAAHRSLWRASRSSLATMDA